MATHTPHTHTHVLSLSFSKTLSSDARSLAHAMSWEWLLKKKFQKKVTTVCVICLSECQSVGASQSLPHATRWFTFIRTPHTHTHTIFFFAINFLFEYHPLSVRRWIWVICDCNTKERERASVCRWVGDYVRWPTTHTHTHTHTHTLFSSHFVCSWMTFSFCRAMILVT